MHQANQNLMDRVARALEVDAARFYSNIRRYGNTSSASMLIAASEWWLDPGLTSRRRPDLFRRFWRRFSLGRDACGNPTNRRMRDEACCTRNKAGAPGGWRTPARARQGECNHEQDHEDRRDAAFYVGHADPFNQPNPRP